MGNTGREERKSSGGYIISENTRRTIECTILFAIGLHTSVEEDRSTYKCSVHLLYQDATYAHIRNTVRRAQARSQAGLQDRQIPPQSVQRDLLYSRIS